MATQLTIVNNILRRLREDTVASVSENDYSQLIAMWLNDGMRVVGDTFAFSSLNHEITIAVVAGTTVYDLSKIIANGGDVPDSERPTSSDSMLLWDLQRGGPSAYIFDDAADTQANAWLHLITEEDRYRKQQTDRGYQNRDPSAFSLEQTPSGDGLQITLWPEPLTTRTVRIKFWTHQAEFLLDGTDNNTSVIIHNATVEAYVHLIASNERGEEMGEPGNILERRYLGLLGATVEASTKSDQRINVYESHRD